MTNSQSKLFTLSKEKRPEVDGSTNQMFGKHGKATIIKRIEQNLLAAIGMVTENARLQYLFNPHIHYDIDGNPSKIIGNASNEKGEFTLLEIDIKSSLTYFTAVKINDRAPAGTEGPSPLPQVLCEGTKWATNDTESVIICSLCKLFPVFFGQEIVHGSLTDDETREKFGEAGPGFEAYGDLANAAFTSAVDNNKILAKIGAITTGNGEGTYIHADFDTNERVLSTNGATTSYVLASSAGHPEITKSIKSFFVAGSVNDSSSGPNPTTYILKNADEADKDSAAKDGIAALGLLLLGGKINWETGKITNPTLCIFSKSMQTIQNGSRGIMTSRMTTMLNTALKIGDDADPLNILSQGTLTMIQAVFSGLLLKGQFQTEPSLTLEANEASTVGVCSFMAQTGVDQEKLKNMEWTEKKKDNERHLEVPASQRTKEKTTISQLGKITGPESVQNTIINTVRVVHTIADIEKMEAEDAAPIMLQLFMRHLRFLRTKKNVRWAELLREDHPQLGCNLFSEIDSMFCKIATGATDFRNLNVVTTSEPITSLILTDYEEAVATSVATLTQMSNLVIRSAPVAEESKIYKALMARNKPTPSLPKNGGGETNGGGTNSPTNTPTRGKGRGRDGGGASTTPSQGSAKKARSDSDGTSKDKGFIILADVNMDVGKILPNNMAKGTKPCPKFITQGLDCTHDDDNCPEGQHAYTPKKIPAEELQKMAVHLNGKKHGWFNKNSMHKIKNHYQVPSDLKCVGNKHGLSKST